MARPAKVPSVTASQAKYILEKLIDEHAVSAADVRRHLAGMWSEMSVLEKRIAALRAMAASVHPVRRAKEVVRRVVKRVRRKAPSPEVAASRKLQGQYIAAIRQLPKNQRPKYAKMAKEDGRDRLLAAIRKAAAK